MKRGIRSIRARIALACAGLFLVMGGVLIAATYGLVGHFNGLNTVKDSAAEGAVKFYHLCRAASVIRRSGRRIRPPTAQPSPPARIVVTPSPASE